MEVAPPLATQRAAFFNYIDEHAQQGLSCQGDSPKYIDYSALERYWDENKIRQTLTASSISQTENVALIRERYLRVFTVLFKTSHLWFLQLLMNHNNDDTTLPWTELPSGLRGIPQGDTSFSDFWEAQWTFCPLLFNSRERLFNLRLHRRHILPLANKVEMDNSKEERVAKTFRMDLSIAAHSHLPEKDQLPKQVILKTYEQGYGPIYDNGTMTYRDILPRTANTGSCLAGFSWFSQDNRQTVTLVFEPPQRTLLDCFQDNRPPYNRLDISTMWESILGVVAGVVTVHGQMDSQRFHQNLHPSNILIFSEKSDGDVISFTARTADICASHSGTMDPACEPLDIGTRNYDAPEIRHGNVTAELFSPVDMWSLGCLLLDLSIFITFGNHGLEEFAAQRRKETALLRETIGNFAVECFHDGVEALDCVKHVIQWVNKDGRRSDSTTPQVVDLVLHDLLVPAERRRNAMDVFNSLREIIQSSRSQPDFHLESGIIIDEGFSSEKQTLLHAEWAPTPSCHSRQGSPATVHIEPFSATESRQSSFSTNDGDVPKIQLGPSRPDPTDGERNAFPKVRIKELEDWIYMKKTNQPTTPLQGWREVQKLLDNRDFIFILDNSKYMQEHQEEVLKLVDSLAYLVKNLDSDGSGIICTSDFKRREKFKTASTVREFISKKFKEGSQIDCNMEGTLQSTLDEIREQLSSSSSSKRKSIMKAMRPGSAKKPVSILVFTNGRWNDSIEGVGGVDHPIELLIKTMKRQSIARSHVAIQFLRFGSDQIGEQRLRILDDDLGRREENIGYDIVDQKPITANIWDILVGSVSNSVD